MGEVDQTVDVPVRATPKKIRCVKISTTMCWDGEDKVAEEDKTHPAKINTIQLAVHYKDNVGVYIGKRFVKLEPGTIRAAMEKQCIREIAVTEAEVGDEDYPKLGDYEAMFDVAVAKVEDGDTPGQIGALLGGQMWGRIMLADAWDSIR